MLQLESARFPEIPAMDEAGNFSHTPTQEPGKGKAKHKYYWWWSPKRPAWRSCCLLRCEMLSGLF